MFYQNNISFVTQKRVDFQANLLSFYASPMLRPVSNNNDTFRIISGFDPNMLYSLLPIISQIVEP